MSLHPILVILCFALGQVPFAATSAPTSPWKTSLRKSFCNVHVCIYICLRRGSESQPLSLVAKERFVDPKAYVSGRTERPSFLARHNNSALNTVIQLHKQTQENKAYQRFTEMYHNHVFNHTDCSGRGAQNPWLSTIRKKLRSTFPAFSCTFFPRLWYVSRFLYFVCKNTDLLHRHSFLHVFWTQVSKTVVLARFFASIGICACPKHHKNACDVANPSLCFLQHPYGKILQTKKIKAEVLRGQIPILFCVSLLKMPLSNLKYPTPRLEELHSKTQCLEGIRSIKLLAQRHVWWTMVHGGPIEKRIFGSSGGNG